MKTLTTIMVRSMILIAVLAPVSVHAERCSIRRWAYRPCHLQLATRYAGDK